MWTEGKENAMGTEDENKRGLKELIQKSSTQPGVTPPRGGWLSSGLLPSDQDPPVLPQKISFSESGVRPWGCTTPCFLHLILPCRVAYPSPRIYRHISVLSPPQVLPSTQDSSTVNQYSDMFPTCAIKIHSILQYATILLNLFSA